MSNKLLQPRYHKHGCFLLQTGNVLVLTAGFAKSDTSGLLQYLGYWRHFPRRLVLGRLGHSADRSLWEKTYTDKTLVRIAKFVCLAGKRLICEQLY